MIMDMILTCLGEVYGSNSGLGFGECCSGSSRDQRCAGGGGGGHGNTARHHHGGHGDIPAPPRPWRPGSWMSARRRLLLCCCVTSALAS